MKLQTDRTAATAEILKNVDAFSSLSETSIFRLAHSCKYENFAKGEIIFFQSDPSESAYLVHKGKISIVLNSPDGREMVINEMRRGDLFGELGILTNKSRSTSAIANANSELLVFPRRIFLEVVDTDLHLARTLLELTANRLQVSGKRESALAFLDAQARLAGLLLELEKAEHDKGYVTISQDELAHRTGLIRQTVAKVLGKWRRAGWLITGRGRILILNRKELAALEKNILV